MKTLAVQTQKVVTLQLTEREVVVLRAALNAANVDDVTQLSARTGGVNDLDEDDFTELYGQLGEVLR